MADAAGLPWLLTESESNGNVSGLVSRWSQMVMGDDKEWQALVEEDEGFDANSTLSSWLEPLSEVLGRSTNLQMSPEDILDLDELVARVTLFPLLLVGLASRQGNLVLFVVYYLARLLGRLNVKALASYEARELGMTSADEQVAEQEASFVRKAQQETLNSFGIALLINVVIFFGISAFIVWQLSAGLLGAFTPEPPDPLAF